MLISKDFFIKRRKSNLKIMKYQYEILGTAIVLVALVISFQISKSSIRKFTIMRSIDPNRKKFILNFSYLMYYLIAGIALALIWGVNLKEFTIFISSVLAVLGIGFVAQWSLLSNLTSSVILFFYHPLRIGDRIRVLDKDFDWTGEIKDITGFYLLIKTDQGEQITLPNSLVMQKGIEMLDKRQIVKTLNSKA